MLRHLGGIAVCACAVARFGCDGRRLTAPDSPPPPSSDPNAMVTVEFGGRVVNVDVGGPVANVRVSLHSWGPPGGGLRRGGPMRRTLQRLVRIAHSPSHSISNRLEECLLQTDRTARR